LRSDKSTNNLFIYFFYIFQILILKTKMRGFAVSLTHSIFTVYFLNSIFHRCVDSIINDSLNSIFILRLLTIRFKCSPRGQILKKSGFFFRRFSSHLILLLFTLYKSLCSFNNNLQLPSIRLAFHRPECFKSETKGLRVTLKELDFISLCFTPWKYFKLYLTTYVS
jgi:hypothetical protein